MLFENIFYMTYGVWVQHYRLKGGGMTVQIGISNNFMESNMGFDHK